MLCPARAGLDKALMTLLRASSLTPVLPVFPARSDPARSIRRSLEVRTDLTEELSLWQHCRLERSFIPVMAICRSVLPVCRTLRSSSAELMTISLAPITTGNTHNHTTVGVLTPLI
uniref:Uncharacterized protein n=1 Tax=Cynoglossus semilaevis TaxID=244447 RepID=A0A3P8UY24_CYNSE